MEIDKPVEKKEDWLESKLFFIGRPKKELSMEERYHSGPCEYSNNPWNWRCKICGKIVGD